jgi:hypothetical protein
MNKIKYYLAFIILLSSCAPPNTLYTWGKKKYSYHKTSYNYLKVSDDESISNLKLSYLQIIQKQRGTRNAVPPGIYADYGFLLVSNNETEKGIDMLNKEMELYPESSIFITRILKMLKNEN